MGDCSERMSVHRINPIKVVVLITGTLDSESVPLSKHKYKIHQNKVE